jgi:hypothetical protein
MFTYADSCARAAANELDAQEDEDEELDEEEDEDEELDEEEDEDEDLDEQEDEDEDLDEQEDEDEDLDEQEDDETLSNLAMHEEVQRLQTEADSHFNEWWAAGDDRLPEQDQEAHDDRLPEQDQEAQDDPIVPYRPPVALGPRSTTVPPGISVTRTPNTPGRRAYVMGWGKFMEGRALKIADPYIDGKVPHPECTSSTRGINRCREDTLEAADRAIQDYLRANCVANAESYTPFMDYRF